jgi:hypothetical protein
MIIDLTVRMLIYIVLSALVARYCLKSKSKRHDDNGIKTPGATFF